MSSNLSLQVILGAALGAGFKGVFGDARGEIVRVGQALQEARGKAGKITTYQNLEAELGKARVKLEATQREAMKLRRALRADPESAGLQRQLARTEQQADKLSRAVEVQRSRLRAAGAELRAAGVDARNLAAEEARLTGVIQQQNRAWQQQKLLAERRAKIGDAMRTDALKLGAAVATVAVAAIPIAGAVRDAADFDYQLQLIGNTADMTAAQVAGLKGKILAASKETGQSIGNVRQSFGYLVAAGMETDVAARSIVTIGRTATAAGADIGDVSQASFTLIDALKIAPEGLQGALDILAQAGKEGNVELRDMARQLPQLGAGFVALKMGGRDAVATMGAALEVAKKGAGSADEAANNMQNFMAKVLSPETLAKAKKNFGLDLYQIMQDAQDAGGNPFEAAIEAIKEVTQGDQKKLGEIFGDMQAQNFLRPLMQNWDEYLRIKKKALAATGVTDRDFAKVSATTHQQLLDIGNAWGRLRQSLGSAIGAPIGQLSTVLVPLLDQLATFTDQHPKVVGGVVMIVGALVAFRVAALAAKVASAGLRLSMLNLAEVAPKVGEAVAARGGGIGGAFARLGGATRVLGLLRTGIGALLGPVGLLIGVLTVGALLVRKYWQPIKAFFGGVLQGVGDAFASVGASLREAFAPLKPIWDAVAGSLESVWRWLEPVKSTAADLDAAAEAGWLFGRVLGGVFTAVGTLAGWAVDLFVWFGKAIGTGVGFLVVGTGRALDAFAGAWNTAISTVGALWEGLKAAVGAVFDWIGEKIDWFVGKWEAVKGAVGGTWQAIKDRVGSAVDAGARLGQSVADSVRSQGAALAQRGAAAAVIAASVAGSPLQAGAQPTVQQSNTYQMTVQAAPGMDERALALEVRKQLDQRDREAAARTRTALRDRE